MATLSVFTLEAVNSMVPRLQKMMEAQMGRRSDIEQRLEQLSKLVGKVPETIQVDDQDPPHVRDLKQDLVARVDRYQSGWREIEEMGAVLKDPRQGLLDFYGQVDGKLVWLCWRYGEDAVTHYHGLDEGFSGRRPIEPTMRQRHLN
ncbi:MAG TPA: DUF2203 domain-containing protein [Polyangiaceae bacterium]|jgi:hypothetical protein